MRSVPPVNQKEREIFIGLILEQTTQFKGNYFTAVRRVSSFMFQ